MLRSKGGDIVAVSTEPVAKLQRGRQQFPELPCILASDENGDTVSALHLQHDSFGRIGRILAIPANILMDQNGTVVWAHYASIVMDRPSPQVVLQKAFELGSNAALLSNKSGPGAR